MSKQTNILDHVPAKSRMWGAQSWRAVLGRDATIAIGIGLMVLAWVVPFLHMPYVLDSLWMPAGTDYILKHNFRPVLPAGWDTQGHPVLLYQILALGWVLFGQSLWVAHAIMAVFAFVFVWYTYRVAHLIYGQQTALLAVVLLLFYPLFRAQVTVVLYDLPVAAVAMMAVYYLLQRKTLAYLICGSAMVLIKETAVLLVPAVLIFVWLRDGRTSSWRRLIGASILHSVPVFVLLGWFWYHLVTTGWLPGWDEETFHGPSVLAAFAPSALLSTHGVLFQLVNLTWNFFGKWFLTGVLTVVMLIYSFSLRPFAQSARSRLSLWSIKQAIMAQPIWRVWGSKEVVALLTLPILIHLIFAASNVASRGGQLQRYLLFEYGLFFILAARAILGVFKRPRTVALFTALVLLIFVVGWETPWLGYSVTAPSNRLYVDHVATHMAAAAFIEHNYPDQTVLANWPAYVELAMPSQGYVTKPVSFITWEMPKRYFKPRIDALGGRSFADPATLTADDFDLLYYSSRTYRDEGPLMLDLVQRFDLTLLAEFNQNGEYVAIYGHSQ